MEVDSLLLANQGPVLVLACVLLAVLALAVQFLVDDGYLRDQKGQAIPGPGKRHFAPIVGHGLAMARARLQHAPTALGKQVRSEVFFVAWPGWLARKVVADMARWLCS